MASCMSEREREKISSSHEAASGKGSRGPSVGKGIKAWEPEQEEPPRLQTAEVGDAGKGFRTGDRNLPRERRVVRPDRPTGSARALRGTWPVVGQKIRQGP